MDKDCMYCVKGPALETIMGFICAVDGFPLYLMRNQTYRGRTVLAFNEHVGKIAEMTPEQCSAFFIAVQKVAKAITEIFSPGQVNIGMYADKMSHLHCHITPKYQGGPDWGGIFQMNPQPAVSLESSEYETIAENIRRTLAEL